MGLEPTVFCLPFFDEQKLKKSLYSVLVDFEDRVPALPLPNLGLPTRGEILLYLVRSVFHELDSVGLIAHESVTSTTTNSYFI